MQNSEIQWCDHTWNIARGCTKVDGDCKFCYMMRDGDRYKYDGKLVQRTKTVFNAPLKIKDTQSQVWPGPPLVFMSSLTDVFHPAIDPFRAEAFGIMRRRRDLIFQILTKRTERISKLLPDDWGDGWDNVWVGTSVGHQEADHRIDELVEIPAKMRFLSLEPLWSSIELPFDIPFRGGVNDYYADRIDWVIVGGESGNDTGKWHYRECKIEWIEQIIADCRYYGIPVFVKQLGTHLAKELKLSDRHGGNINEWPEHLRVREFPKA